VRARRKIWAVGHGRQREKKDVFLLSISFAARRKSWKHKVPGKAASLRNTTRVFALLDMLFSQFHFPAHFLREAAEFKMR